MLVAYGDGDSRQRCQFSACLATACLLYSPALSREGAYGRNLAQISDGVKRGLLDPRMAAFDCWNCPKVLARGLTM